MSLVEPVFQDEWNVLFHGDNRDVLKFFPDESVDAIVTDPPYELGFMGKSWDASGIAYDVLMWQQALRVLKPGGHLLAFGGTRTYHRMACAVEDAGFEIRDCIVWLYGQGFPKSMNIGDGKGTALKPGNEPIVLARKPLIGTVVDNVLEHGTGALNIDGARIPRAEGDRTEYGRNEVIPGKSGQVYGEYADSIVYKPHEGGRWPANVILDEDAAADLDDIFGGTSRFFFCAKATKKERGANNKHPTVKPIVLMEYLIKLVTPAEGIVLDLFAGSGTTLKAARQNGFRSIGIEMTQEYIPTIIERLAGT